MRHGCLLLSPCVHFSLSHVTNIVHWQWGSVALEPLRISMMALGIWQDFPMDTVRLCFSLFWLVLKGQLLARSYGSLRGVYGKCGGGIVQATSLRVINEFQ